MAIVRKEGAPLRNKSIGYGVISIGVFLLMALVVLALARANMGLTALVVAGLSVMLVNYIWGKSASLMSGSWGEHKSLSKIKDALPDEYQVFVGVKVHDKMESDVVIVGPTGVFVLEVKNLNGKLEGEEQDKVWTLHKTGRQGGKYTKDIPNPLGQMRRNVYILSQYLKLSKCPAWVEGAVLFANSDTGWLNNIPNKCLYLKDIGSFITRYPARKTLTAEKIWTIASCLEKCVGGAAMGKDEFEAKTKAVPDKPAYGGR